MWTLALIVISFGLTVLTAILGWQMHRLVLANIELTEIIETQAVIIDSYIEDRKRRGE